MRLLLSGQVGVIFQGATVKRTAETLDIEGGTGCDAALLVDGGSTISGEMKSGADGAWRGVALGLFGATGRRGSTSMSSRTNCFRGGALKCNACRSKATNPICRKTAAAVLAIRSDNLLMRSQCLMKLFPRD
jgi:hypothetical protein